MAARRSRTLAAAALVLLVAALATWATGRPAGRPAPLPPAGSAAAAVGQEAGLLRRWAPTLHLDRRERARPVSATAFLAAARREPGRLVLVREPRSAPTVMGHAVRDGGRLWLQWWVLWADNPQDRGVLRTGRHEGDWELVQAVLDPALRPAAATYAQHSWAVGCRVDAAPQAWIAHGSHAAYPRPGTGDRPWPDPTDEAPGDGATLRPAVAPIGAWIAHRGRWGATRAGWVPGESSSPRGPALQPGDRFTRPAALHASARGCTSDPPAWPWWFRGTAALLLASALAAGLALASRPRGA